MIRSYTAPVSPRLLTETFAQVYNKQKTWPPLALGFWVSRTFLQIVLVIRVWDLFIYPSDAGFAEENGRGKRWQHPSRKDKSKEFLTKQNGTWC